MCERHRLMREVYKAMLSRFEQDFRHWAFDIDGLEDKTQQHLNTEPAIYLQPASRSDLAACRQAIRLAALEIFWREIRQQLKLGAINISAFEQTIVNITTHELPRGGKKLPLSTLEYLWKNRSGLRVLLLHAT